MKKLNMEDEMFTKEQVSYSLIDDEALNTFNHFVWEHSSMTCKELCQMLMKNEWNQYTCSIRHVVRKRFQDIIMDEMNRVPDPDNFIIGGTWIVPPESWLGLWLRELDMMRTYIPDIDQYENWTDYIQGQEICRPEKCEAFLRDIDMPYYIDELEDGSIRIETGYSHFNRLDGTPVGKPIYPV